MTKMPRMSKTTKKAGRRTKLTPELIVQAGELIRNHMTRKTTCEVLGIARPTFYRWMQEGEVADSGLKRDFCDTVKKARGMSAATLIQQISRDASWQAKAWLLERLYPEQFGRRKLIEYIGPTGETVSPPPAAPAVIKIIVTESSRLPE